MGDRACRDCADWNPRTHGEKGECLQSGYYSNSYKLVGMLGRAMVYEDTKPDHWCDMFRAKP